jgi:hypothetical protein
MIISMRHEMQLKTHGQGQRLPFYSEQIITKQFHRANPGDQMAGSLFETDRDRRFESERSARVTPPKSR